MRFTTAIGGEVAFGEVGVGGGEAHEGEEAFGLAIGGGFGGVVVVKPGFEGGLAGAEERGEGGGGGGVVEEDGAGPGHLGEGEVEVLREDVGEGGFAEEG